MNADLIIVFSASIVWVLLIRLRQLRRRVKNLEETKALDANLDFARADIERLTVRVSKLERALKLGGDGGVERVKNLEETKALDANLDFARADIERLTVRVSKLERALKLGGDGGVERFRSRFD